MEDLLYAIIQLIVTVIMILIIGALLAFFMMLLWNWLMPVIFGLKAITFLQAWGLFILCNLLFKTKWTTKWKTKKNED